MLSFGVASAYTGYTPSTLFSGEQTELMQQAPLLSHQIKALMQRAYILVIVSNMVVQHSCMENKYFENLPHGAASDY